MSSNANKRSRSSGRESADTPKRRRNNAYVQPDLVGGTDTRSRKAKRKGKIAQIDKQTKVLLQEVAAAELAYTGAVLKTACVRQELIVLYAEKAEVTAAAEKARLDAEVRRQTELAESDGEFSEDEGPVSLEQRAETNFDTDTLIQPEPAQLAANSANELVVNPKTGSVAITLFLSLSC